MTGTGRCPACTLASSAPTVTAWRYRNLAHNPVCMLRRRQDKMREEVEAALAALNAGRVRQMLMVGSSRRYAERLTQTLRLKGGQEAKMVAAAQGIARKQQEARKGLVGVQPKLEGVVGRVKELKRQIEEGMGRILGGGKINLQGELNSIIAGVQR